MFDVKFYNYLDNSRRFMGAVFDMVGSGPKESPFRVIYSTSTLTLRAYECDVTDTSPTLLIIPAPIKRGYLWDMSPEVSVVQKCIQSGIKVYMIYWEQPGENEKDFGLAEYADRFIIESIDAIYSDSGDTSVFIAGHSLGGTLSAIFSSLYPEKVKGLILLGAPLHFGEHVGAFGKVVTPTTDVKSILSDSPSVPGSFLNRVSFMASPVTFGLSRRLDWLRSITDYRAMKTHLLVERWTLDEMPFTRHFFEEIVENLYRDDRFMKGTLMIGGRRAFPESINAPLINVIDKKCEIVPPEAVLLFHSAVKSDEKKVLWYEGDKGVSLQHVGMLVGHNAHLFLWPHIISWIHEHNR